MLHSYITQWWYIRVDNSGRKRGCVTGMILCTIYYVRIVLRVYTAVSTIH